MAGQGGGRNHSRTRRQRKTWRVRVAEEAGQVGGRPNAHSQRRKQIMSTVSKEALQSGAVEDAAQVGDREKIDRGHRC
jgi:hypothetical protein